MGKCKECGKGTQFNFPLCKTCHNKQIKELTTDNVEKRSCLICEDETTGLLCKDCFKLMMEIYEGIDKNRQLFEIKDYYYNLKNYIFRYKKGNEPLQLLKLYAIAMCAKDVFRDNSLIQRVQEDIIALQPKKIEKNETEEKQKSEIKKEENETNIPGWIRTEDGHFVKSDYEKQIDDLIFRLGCLHVYGREIYEISETVKYCDWYLPIINQKGIFVEMWGMDTEDYNSNRKEKEDLYKKYKLKLLSIEKDDLKGDSQRLIAKFKKEYDKLKKQIIEESC